MVGFRYNVGLCWLGGDVGWVGVKGDVVVGLGLGLGVRRCGWVVRIFKWMSGEVGVVFFYG